MSMNELRISPKKNTPEVILDPKGTIKLTGRSMGENVTEFFKQIEDWVDEYICDPADITCVEFHMEYLPTFTTRFYISFLSKISSVKLTNKKVNINWYYDEGDEDILEKGECISSVLDIPFNFVKII